MIAPNVVGVISVAAHNYSQAILAGPKVPMKRNRRRRAKSHKAEHKNATRSINSIYELTLKKDPREAFYDF